jgi:hypothetical protein
MFQAMDVATICSSKKEPPRLVIIQHEDESLQGVLLADETSIDCNGSSSVFDLLLNLHAAYYAWDLSYPTTYQLTAFFQAHMLRDETENTFRSSGLIKLEKALKL